MTFEHLDLCDGPACPKCGCQDAEVLQEPKDPGKNWFGSGRARCNACGRVFHFREVPEPQPPVEYQEPVVLHQEPVVDASTGPYQMVRKPLCPRCESERVRVTHTLPSLRRYQCKECGERFKREREAAPM